MRLTCVALSQSRATITILIRSLMTYAQTTDILRMTSHLLCLIRSQVVRDLASMVYRTYHQ